VKFTLFEMSTNQADPPFAPTRTTPECIASNRNRQQIRPAPKFEKLMSYRETAIILLS
jgi:hypothetical protein